MFTSRASGSVSRSRYTSGGDGPESTTTQVRCGTSIHGRVTATNGAPAWSSATAIDDWIQPCQSSVSKSAIAGYRAPRAMRLATDRSPSVATGCDGTARTISA